MFFTIDEMVKWLGLTVFEIWSIGLLHAEDINVEPQDERCQELWRAFRDEAGPWQTYRFTLEEWDVPKKAIAKLPQDIAPVVDNSDFDGILTREMIATGLSNLNRCPVFCHYSYTKCVLSKKKINDIKTLGSYHYLQYLDVSCNKLRTLKSLGNLPFLKYLDASRNLLTSILDFKAPHFLTFVNLSYNKFEVIRDLSEFWSITDLNLSHNSIRTIDGLLGLRYLTILNLSYNRIETIKNLMNLRIQFLYLQNNQIQAFDDDQKAMLDTLNNIRTVNLAGNQISSLKMFEKVENLECLEIPYNHISQLLDIYYLRNLKYLNKLNLTGNAVTNLRRYIEVCITNINNLVYLDGEHINYEFWLQKSSNRASDVNQIASHQRLKLLILEELNKPQIWDWLLPYDVPPLVIIVLVGLQASRRAHIAQKFCQENETVVLGIPYTTRTKHAEEIEGELFYYVNENEFRTMLKEGKFLTYQEHLGYYYGFAHSEFKKAEDGIMLLYTDLTMALSIKSRFFNTKLVLTLPSTRKIHLDNLMKTYGVRLSDSGTMKIINSPAAVKYCEMEFNKTKQLLIEEDVRVIVEDLVIHVSQHDQLTAGTVEQPDSTIVQLWRSPSNICANGRKSHRVPVHYVCDPDHITSIGSLQRTLYSDESKMASFSIRDALQNSDTSQGNTTPEPDHTSSQKSSERDIHETSEPKVHYIISTEKRDRSEVDSNNSQHSTEAIVEQSSKPLPVITKDLEKTVSDELQFAFKYPGEDGAPRYLYDENKVDDENVSRVRRSRPSNFFMQHASYSDVVFDDERVRGVFEGELNRREELLDLHWTTPGLFRELVFSDHEEETFEKLRQLLKDVRKSSSTRMRPMFDYDNDESVKHLIDARVKRCFKNIEKELSISDKQAAEYFVDKESHLCFNASICKNSACPPF